MTNDHRQSKMTRLAAIFFAVWFVVLSVGTPRETGAQAPLTPVAETNVMWLKEQAEKSAASFMQTSWKFQLQLAIVNMFSRFAEQAAYETAVWVASGGKAESPLFNPQDGDNFWADTALGAGLQFVDDMDKNIVGPALSLEDGFGLANFICAPDLRIQAVIKLAIMDRLKPKPPLCTWKQFRSQWSKEGLAKSLSGSGIGFEQGESDLSAALEVHNSISDKLIGKQQREFWQYVQNDGFKPLSDKISGLTKTPADYVKTELTSNMDSADKNAEGLDKFTVEAVNNWDYFFSMLGQAGQALAINFAATLAAQTIQRQVLGRGLFYNLTPPPLPGDPYSAPSSNNREQAQAVYASFIAPKVATASEYDPIAEFATCDPQRRQPTTCVIDTNFQDAIRRSLSGQPITVKEAMDAKLLHEEWQLIPAGTIDDLDPNCYQRAYCASNLAKLRLTRVLPVGWEFAANHETNREEPHVTLGQAIRDFNKTGGDNICNNANVGSGETQESPYCGLIDPNWVLKFPITQCRTRGPGETLLDRSGNVRADVCTDYASCTETDANGRCIGEYGFCIREKNTWYVRGTSCPPQAAACRALRSRTGSDLSIITTTVDSAQCNAENAGCLWYASKRNASGNWISATDRRYFNRNVEQCTQADEGCTELIPASAAGRNLIINPSFERDEDRDGKPDGWIVDFAVASGLTKPVYSTDGNQSVDGRAAVQTTRGAKDNNNDYTGRPPGVFQQLAIPVVGGASYTLSAHAKRAVASGSGLRVHLKFYQDGQSVDAIAGEVVPSAGCTVDGSHPGISLWITPPANSYVRGSCSFTTPTRANQAMLVLLGTDTDRDFAWADAIQLEEGVAASSFTDAYNTQAPKSYLRVASSDLNCDDPTASLRNPSCGTFAKTCEQSDIGCERYTATDAAFSVNGKYTENDRCPAQCVGYSAFKEASSNYDQKDAFDFFIPSTARQCSSAEVGCSEFTNLDRLASGGEAREYYTFLRQCRKETDDEANPATYYTWEGSATQGYQLRSFRLKSSTTDSNSAPHVTVPTSEADCGPNGTNEYGKAGQSDCRAFYSQDGTINYRRLSQTVIITDDCVPYRLSQNLSATETRGTTTQTICEWKGGAFTNGACTFKGYRAESRQCNAQAVGCREYRGNSGGAVQTILSTSFEPASVGQQGWFAEKNCTGTGSNRRCDNGGAVTGETLITGEHSFRIDQNASAYYPHENTAPGLSRVIEGMDSPTCSQQPGGVYDQNKCHAPLLRPGGTYELILIGKGVGTVSSRLINRIQGISSPMGEFAKDSVIFGASWQRVALGPVIIPTSTQPTARAYLGIYVTGKDIFLDSITLREIPSTIAVVKNSWVTPSACDRATIDPNSAPQAQGMLGCREYKDRAGTVAALRSFTKLCGSDVVGCTAFYDTRGNQERDKKTYNSGALDKVEVPADTPRYLVDAPEKRCQATVAGCRRVALPTLDRTADAKGAVVADGWKETFLKDIPAKYEGPGATLCTDEALFCEEFSGRDGSLLEFKDPGNRTCTFRGDPVDIGGGRQRVGWFRSASLVPSATGVAPTPVGCDPNYVIRGAEYGIRKNNDAAYNTSAGKRVGLCESAQDLCTEFRDTTDQTPSYPDGKPYQVIKDASLDLASCAGTVSRKEGCALLNDTTRPEKTWSAAATYAESDVQKGAAIPPINCDQTPEKCKRCVLERKCRDVDGDVQSNGPSTCSSDNQCKIAEGYTCRGGEPGKQCTGTGQEICLANEACKPYANDSNLIAKVQRDRACSEWLKPDTCMETFSKIQNREVKSCYGLAQVTDQRGVRDASTAKPALTQQAYQSREKTWGAQEASGYAIPNVAQLPALRQVTATWDEGCKLEDVSNCTACNPSAANRSCNVEDRRLSYVVAKGCITGNTQLSNWRTCNSDAPILPEFGGEGICFDGVCAYGVKKPSANLNKNARVKEWPRPQCKVFPESDSPFPRDTVFETNERRPLYAQANVCLDSQDCTCSYKKGIFEAGSLYYSKDTTPHAKACIGGVSEGGLCDSDAECGDRGTCSRLKETRTVQGIEGYCLEQDDSMTTDSSTRCRTFLPVDQLSGSVDVNNVVDTAQIQLPVGQDWYCADRIRDTSVASPFPLADSPTLVIRRALTDPSNLINDLEDRGTLEWSDNQSLPYEPFGPPTALPSAFVSLPGAGQRGSIQVKKFVTKGSGGTDCENRSGEGWCVWPATSDQDPARHACSGSDIGCRYAVNGAHNFLGCYESPDSADGAQQTNVIYYPWRGEEVRKDKIAQITVRFRNPDELCNVNVDDNSDFIGDVDDPEKPTVELSAGDDERDGAPGDWAEAVADDTDKFLAAHALFDANEEFIGMAIEAWEKHGGDEGTFYIDELRMQFKPGCFAVARIRETEKTYPFTDVTWLGRSRTSAPTDLSGYTVQTVSRPWGGITKFSSSTTPLPYITQDDAALFNSQDLPQIFAKALTLLGIPLQRGNALIRATDGTRFGEVPRYSADLNEWDVRDDAQNRKPPQISAVLAKNCDSSGRKCTEDRDLDDEFSVNDKVDGNVVGEGGTLRATLRFFAWADPNHMPIRRMKVDFGDGSIDYDAAQDGSYPNRRGYVDAQWATAVCKNQDFGRSSDACISRPISLEHTYRCVKNTLPACASSNTTNCWDQSENNNDGACVFRPKVFIEDNWGYCTGTCPGDPAGEKCFDQEANSKGECNPTRSQPWVNFGGKVVVLPP